MVAFAITASLGACAGSRSGASFSPDASGDEQHGNSNLIVRTEILRAATANPQAYELIQRLRPRWLKFPRAEGVARP